jgi:predicted nicotinamide N-methyase
MKLELPPLPDKQKLKLRKADGLLGGDVWPAAVALCHYLVDTTNTTSCNDAIKSRIDCVELGAGTGVVGIFAAAALGYDVALTEYRPPCSSSESDNGTCSGYGSCKDEETTEDVDSQNEFSYKPSMRRHRSNRLLDLLQKNVEINSALFSKTNIMPKVCELDFRDPKTIQKVAASSASGRGFNVVLASDVTYTPSLHQPLADTIADLLMAGQTSQCILSHQERLYNVRGEDYQMMQLEQALSEANLEVVHRSYHTIEDGGKTHKVCIIEIQRK